MLTVACRDGKPWLDKRVPISKFIMMPRKMAEFHEQFNQVSQDYINYVRANRNADDVFLDFAESLTKWSFESKYHKYGLWFQTLCLWSNYKTQWKLANWTKYSGASE